MASHNDNIQKFRSIWLLILVIRKMGSLLYSMHCGPFSSTCTGTDTFGGPKYTVYMEHPWAPVMEVYGWLGENYT